MYDEPSEEPSERALDLAAKVRDKIDELRMHAELAAVFEGCRKFDAELRPGLDAQKAREVQRGMGKLEKSRPGDNAQLPASASDDAQFVLTYPTFHDLSLNNYHIHRRPGEAMIIRWLHADQVETFYERLQAHFNVGLEGLREDERQALEWKKGDDTELYLDALDRVEIDMADRFYRDQVRKGMFALSTQTADEMNIAYLCDYIIGEPAAEVVGQASAPGDAPTDKDLAWFFKLYLLRGVIEGIEMMCFFAYLQKTDDSFDF